MDENLTPETQEKDFLPAINLMDFLIENPVTNITSEIFVSERFKKAGLQFTISAMSGEEFADYQKQAIAMGRHRKVNFDTKVFNELLVINHCLNPNFKNETDCKRAGCQSPKQFLYKSLLAGEIVELANQISQLSGFDQELEELTEEVKNS